MKLPYYIDAHTYRGECNCGKCLDRGEQPDPTGHVADMIFFKVAARDEPNKADFLRLTAEYEGDMCSCDPLDGAEHSYLELGGWLGDQGLAMKYMALGSLLGVFDLLTPRTVLGAIDDEMVMRMAEVGLVTVKKKS